MKFGIFRKCVEKIQVSLKSDKNGEYIIRRPVYMHDHISILLRMKNVSEKFVGKIKTHYFYNISFFFRKSCRLWGKVDKYCRAE